MLEEHRREWQGRAAEYAGEEPHEEHYAPDQTSPQGTQEGGLEHGHEEADVNIRSFVNWMIGLIASTLICILVLAVVFQVLLARERAKEKLPSPLFSQRQTPPEPRVFPNIVDDQRQNPDLEHRRKHEDDNERDEHERSRAVREHAAAAARARALSLGGRGRRRRSVHRAPTRPAWRPSEASRQSHANRSTSASVSGWNPTARDRRYDG